MQRTSRTRLHSRLAALGVAAAVAGLVLLGGAGSALAAGDAPLPRVGYCLDGKFLDLELGQPSVDPTYTGAVLAWYIEGRGITCAPIPAGYVTFTTAPDEYGVPGRLYQYWVPAASS